MGDGAGDGRGGLACGSRGGPDEHPRKHEDVVIEKALEKAGAENLVRKEIEENGMSSTDAFKKYGVL